MHTVTLVKLATRIILLGFVGLSSAKSSDDWPMYGHDSQHSFNQTNTTINAGNASTLFATWSFTPGDAVTASPTVVDNVVYVGSWDGYFYALNKHTGALKWKFRVDCQTTVLPIPPHCLTAGQQAPDRAGSDGGLITSTALVHNGRVYFGGGKTLYALRAADGKLLWKRVLCGRPEQRQCETDPNDPTRIFASPVLYQGKLYITHSVDETNGYRGAINAINASNGRIQWTFEVDPFIDAKGKALPGPGQNRGCGNSFGSLAVAEKLGLVFIGTSDCQIDATPPYHETILALQANDGQLKWAYRPREHDTCDFDFGASPNVVMINGRPHVGIGGKDGTYYMLRAETANPAGELLWSKNVVFGGFSGGFIGSTAFDGKHIYGATAYGELGGLPCSTDPRDQAIQDPSYHALAMSNGDVHWQAGFNYSFAGSTVANDVVFNGWAGLGEAAAPSLRAYDTQSGRIVADFPQAGMVNSAAAIVGKMLFFGTGNSFDGAGSKIQAMKLP